MDQILVNPLHSKGIINRTLYGNFSEHLGRCIYQGVFVGRDSPIPNVNGMRVDVVEALRRLELPLLRWPGGCFADEYHWHDGIGDLGSRRRMVNTNWGGVTEDNSFGTHEFMELCRQIGCAPYINANVGSGTVREMAEWVEYLNSDEDSSVVRERRQNGQKDSYHVKYWGIGNESWGCGGNMRPEYYADVYRRYQTYCRDYGENKLFRIACGPNADDYEWTDTFMRLAGRFADAITLHYYTVPGDDWQHKGSATDFDMATYEKTLAKAAKMNDLICDHLAIMDRWDPSHRVGLVVDEWGAWYDVEPGTNPGFLYQQSTMRDAMIAALTLNIFNHHCDRVVMACVAQMVNVLQAVILTDGDRMLLTPTYHVFDLFRAHMDAREAECNVICGEIAGGLKRLSASASVKSGEVTVTVANLSANSPSETEILVAGYEHAHGRILSGNIHDHNTFEAPHGVELAPLQAIVRTPCGFRVTLPPCSVAALTFRA